MGNIIGWILIGICCFYIVRNVYAGSILYPFCQEVSKIWNRNTPPWMQIKGGYRNYYFFVLNPFWWGLLSPLKKKEERKFLSTILKAFRKGLKNLRKLK